MGRPKAGTHAVPTTERILNAAERSLVRVAMRVLVWPISLQKPAFVVRHCCTTLKAKRCCMKLWCTACLASFGDVERLDGPRC